MSRELLLLAAVLQHFRNALLLEELKSPPLRNTVNKRICWLRYVLFVVLFGLLLIARRELVAVQAFLLLGKHSHDLLGVYLAEERGVDFVRD